MLQLLAEVAIYEVPRAAGQPPPGRRRPSRPDVTAVPRSRPKLAAAAMTPCPPDVGPAGGISEDEDDDRDLTEPEIETR